jgi:hypothetical protein
MPEGRETLKPTVPRLLRAFADDRLVLIKGRDGRLLGRAFAQFHSVQEQMVDCLEFPTPAVLFGGLVAPPPGA